MLDQVSPKGEGADEWHSDNTFMARPPMGSILRAVQLPPVGGDTCFANMYAAYEGLSEPMRELVRRARRRARHHEADAQGDRRGSHDPRPRRDAGAVCHRSSTRSSPCTRRPAVAALFVNRNSTTHIVGLTDRENEALLPFLLDHVRSPEYQCRFHWEPGSMAFWDNRYGAALRRRRLHRAARHAPRHHRRSVRPARRGRHP